MKSAGFGYGLALASWLCMACSEPLPAKPVGAADANATVDAAEADAAMPSDAVAEVDATTPEFDTANDATADTATDTATDTAADTATDTAQTDTADATAEVAPPPKGVPTAKITTPLPGAVVELGKPVELAGIVSDSLAPPADLLATWTSDKDGLIGTSKPDAAGVVKWTAAKLSPGKHLIQLEAKNPQGVAAADAVALGICAWASPESFDTKLDGAKWKIYGDASWDPGGWLEMTGNAQSKFGKIWNVVDYVQPGDVQISFQIQTGGGMNGGADGFALSVIDAKDVAELEGILAKAGNGGCLGYGVAGGCGTLQISAFHLEIDTFANNGDPNTDPTPDNHIAVTLDGDATKHWLWAPAPTIEDLQWHKVTVEVKLDVVRVTLDGAELFNKAIPNFKFRGGYIGFSGSTGWASNYHRFDNLQILQQCIVK
jgi:hypothetical protein